MISQTRPNRKLDIPQKVTQGPQPVESTKQASKQASKQGLREREAEGSTKSKEASEGQEGG